MAQVCAQGKNMTNHVIADDGWAVVPFDKGTRYPTFGYEVSNRMGPGVL